MLTPQDLQEVYFEKARFGGYVMQSVDNFLEPLMNDYLTLYKENALLKSKMRLLVERLEAYRAKEGELKQAAENAEKDRAVLLEKAEQDRAALLAKTERECAELLAGAENSARTRSRDMDVAVLEEEQRLNRARAATQDFVSAVEQAIRQQQDSLALLKGLGLDPKPLQPTAPAAPIAPAAPAAPVQEPAKKAYDFESEADEPKPQPAPQPVPTLPQEEEIAAQIEQNVERIMGEVPAPQDSLAKTRIMPAIEVRREDKFADLQFGKNYDPTK